MGNVTIRYSAYNFLLDYYASILNQIWVLYRVICQTSPILTYPTCIWHPRWVTPFEFGGYLRHQETRFPGLSCGVACMILSLAVFIQYRHVTEGQTDGLTDGRADGHTTTASTALA